MDILKTGAFIKKLRKEKNMTQKELAQKLHITDRAVSKWERGLNAPDIALLEPLAEALDVSVSELIQGERAEALPEDSTKSLLEYSKEEIARKVGGLRKKYAGLLCACLALALLAGGTLLWRSGVLFLLDTKPSPDGEIVVRVYDKKWDFWPLHFTLEDTVQTIEEFSGASGRGTGYISYGDSSYEGLWWAPDSRKYVVSVRGTEGTWLVLRDLERNTGRNLNAVVNLYDWLRQQGLAPKRLEPPQMEYQFLQWGKDSASMLLYYAFEDGNGLHEGYFWYNCESNEVSGILELDVK